MLALMSHRRAVCRGNLVFCSTHRNLLVHRPNTNHSDSLHTSDGAFDMLAPMSHRRVICMGNLVFCSTHRNLSVHRPNTNHVGVEARSHPRVVHINYFFTCDTSQTYLLFQTLLLLFWLHSCTIWTKLTRTDAVFSRATNVVFLCVGFWIFRYAGKIHKNYIKISVPEASTVPKGGLRAAWGAPR